jgi:hypothetical protein
MAKAEVTEVEIEPARPAVTEKRISLELTQEEAQHLFAILSGLGGRSETRQVLTDDRNSPYRELRNALGLEHGYYYMLVDPSKRTEFFCGKYDIDYIPDNVVVEKVKYH